MRAPFTSHWIGLVLVALSSALSPFPVQGADANARFAIKGVGVQTCQQFVDARAARAQAYMRFRSWLEGYVTAVNRYEPQTFDSAPWGTTEVLTVILDNYCQETPDERFVQAVQKLTITLKEDRLIEASPLLTVTVSGQTTRVYEEVLRRVQVALAERGLYDSEPDGVFGPKTREAIATFQISEGLDGTGLPDPLTVWKLLRP